MKLQNAVVLITGANRGIGLAFAQAALARDARKIYAAARNPSDVTLPGVERLDGTTDLPLRPSIGELRPLRNGHRMEIQRA
jgi:NAD(P)-dependent dehydrogenase (short-subunit alcohol dehydrogenase family)